mmetsp:Transcript_15595/g.23370  ORF Transcript_15595/g.23370 Transcript_15595/m.23370 type:complete len:93 (-) Transcript_15595:1237-1515(-)
MFMYLNLNSNDLEISPQHDELSSPINQEDCFTTKREEVEFRIGTTKLHTTRSVEASARSKYWAVLPTMGPLNGSSWGCSFRSNQSTIPMRLL